MASVDFAQFRVQQVRAVENLQLAERQIITLKQQIVELQKSKNDDSLTKSKMKELGIHVRDWLRKYKLELEQTKALCLLQKDQMTSMNYSVIENVNSLKDFLRSKFSNDSALAMKNLELEKSIVELQKSLNTTKQGKQALQEKVFALQAENDELRKENAAVSQNSMALNESYACKLKELEAKYEVISTVYILVFLKTLFCMY